VGPERNWIPNFVYSPPEELPSTYRLWFCPDGPELSHEGLGRLYYDYNIKYQLLVKHGTSTLHIYPSSYCVGYCQCKHPAIWGAMRISCKSFPKTETYPNSGHHEEEGIEVERACYSPHGGGYELTHEGTHDGDTWKNGRHGKSQTPRTGIGKRVTTSEGSQK
jgi:hypothetical protein